ncbi:MAG: hypothetical protein JO278_00105 [Dyella sp.]|nr:hypothetical protein [Dyella sp.]
MLLAGLTLLGLGHARAAALIWTAGALPVAAVLSVSIARALYRREAGVDVLALLAIGLALVLGESLAAAVLALMTESGRALERFAQARSLLRGQERFI